METRYIQPFIQTTRQVFEELFGSRPEPRNPYLIRREELAAWDISGVIGIAGEARGVIVLSFTESLARHLTERLTGRLPERLDDDVIDAVGETVNIIAGNAKQGLEQYKLMISLPSIILGGGHSIGWPHSPIPIVGIPFHVPEGAFHLSVGLENIITLQGTL